MSSSWLLSLLACPRHGGPLHAVRDRLRCGRGCEFPVIDGVPVLLCEEIPATIGVARQSIAAAHGLGGDDPWYLATLGVSDAEREGIRAWVATGAGEIDPVVAFVVGATNGNAYRDVIGSLPRLPIPRWPFERGRGEVLLDLGCNWGRWCLAAASAGYRPIGVDPSLGAVLAGVRTARRLGVDIGFVVADARMLPIAEASVDHVFSYSVLQHFADADVAATLGEMHRVIKDGGSCRVQMATRFGLRNIQQQARRGFRRARGFEVRYRAIRQMREQFSRAIGPSRIEVDCFFGLGLRDEDLDLMTPLAARAAMLSARLRGLARSLPVVGWLADSVFVCSYAAPRAPRSTATGASTAAGTFGIDGGA